MAIDVIPQKIEREAITKHVSDVATYLQKVLGQRVTAYIAGLKDAKVVGMWARGEVKPRTEAMMRLRRAYEATRLIEAAYGSDTAVAWFFGSNSLLGDRAPSVIIRHAKTPEDLQDIIPAAKAFVWSSY